MGKVVLKVDSSIGDMADLARLFEVHRPRLVAMLQRRIDPALAVRVDAEEIVNEGFFLARRKYPQFKKESRTTAYAWLYRIVLDCLIDAWRRENREKRDLARDVRFPAESAGQLGVGLVFSGTSPSEAFERRRLQQKMQKVLDLLSPNDREILWMRHFDQLTHREAADILDLTESAATLRYVRALERLRKLWQKLHGDLETQ